MFSMQTCWLSSIALLHWNIWQTEQEGRDFLCNFNAVRSLFQTCGIWISVASCSQAFHQNMAFNRSNNVAQLSRSSQPENSPSSSCWLCNLDCTDNWMTLFFGCSLNLFRHHKTCIIAWHICLRAVWWSSRQNVEMMLWPWPASSDDLSHMFDFCPLLLTRDKLKINCLVSITVDTNTDCWKATHSQELQP